MHFKLDLPIPPSPFPISIRQKLLVTGSCFAAHIGERLRQYRFDALVNPNGIAFNPLSIIHALLACAEEKMPGEADLVSQNGLWHSWQHHGAFSGADAQEVLQRIRASRQAAALQVRNADHLILTFGSAHVYTLKATGEVVANCHKFPQHLFDKRLLSVKEIITAFEALVQHELFRDKKIMLTVSPVRYIRDGIVENNHSKAVLIRAVHELVAQHRNCWYFPAYEIVMDELRDYRFFERDLVHPNELAIDYVWERFCETAFDQETKQVLKELGQLMAARLHRPLYPGTEQHRAFLKTHHQKAVLLQQQYPFLKLQEELAYFSG